MGEWACGIAGCARNFEEPASLIRHQATDHVDTECLVCGDTRPAGYLSIRHAFKEHNRAEYVRAYDADADAIREREALLDLIEGQVDVSQLLSQLDAVVEDPVASADD